MLRSRGKPRSHGPRRDIIVIGGSAGALGPLSTIVQSLPSDLQAAVFVVLHTTSTGLVRLLASRANLPVTYAADRERIRLGHIYVAPPDLHMCLGAEYIFLERGPKLHFARPAADALFYSAAAAYDSRVIGVVLSGLDADGADGLRRIEEAGGRAMIQDPEEAEYQGMPASALDRDAPDVVKTAQIGPALVRMVNGE